MKHQLQVASDEDFEDAFVHRFMARRKFASGGDKLTFARETYAALKARPWGAWTPPTQTERGSLSNIRDWRARCATWQRYIHRLEVLHGLRPVAAVHSPTGGGM